MKKNPLVSVIIPVRELTYYLLHENLPAYANQTYKNFEILILPNEQVRYDLVLLRTYKNLRIIPTGKITRPAQKRDIGVKRAKGEIIAFIDDDAYPDSSWLELAVKLFLQNKKVLAVCGPGVLPAKTNFWEKVFDDVLKTWIGAGGYSYRFSPKPKRYVLDYPSMNFLIYKKTFVDLGGFNSNYWPGEDSKLCNDLIKINKKSILYSPKVVVYHHRRNNLKSYIKQHANYGFHRGAFFAHGDKNSQELGYLIPTFFLIYIAVLFALLPITLMFNRIDIALIFTLPLFVYCLFAFYLLLKSLFTTKNMLVAPTSVAVLFLTHMVYGFNFIKGLNKGRNKKHSIYD